MTAWIVRTGIAVSRLLTNSAASLRRLTMFEMLLQRAPRGCVQRHLARLETLTLADAHAAGAIVHGDVGNLQRGNLADTQPGLQHELHHGIVPRRQTMGGSTGGAQQGMDLNIGQTGRLAITGGTHGPDMARDVSVQRAGSAGPSA